MIKHGMNDNVVQIDAHVWWKSEWCDENDSGDLMCIMKKMDTNSDKKRYNNSLTENG